MKLTWLRIQQLPGIDSPFALDAIDPGINLVTGPNAIGKSSLIRALGYLVAEPQAGDPPALALAAEFDDGGHWQVSRTGRGYEWRHDGQQAERPPLPDRDALHYYWLSMENLVEVGEGDEHLVEQLRQALAGGYDLRALRGGEFALRPQIGRIEGATLRHARSEQRRVASDYSALRQREATLPALHERIEQAGKAHTRGERLEAALALLAILAEQREIRAALEAFPACMANLRGDELERLEQLEQELERHRYEIEHARRSRQDAEAAAASTGLSEARPAQRELQAERKLLDDIGHRVQQLEDKRREQDAALVQENNALRSLGGNDTPPRLTPAAIAQAEKLATEITRIRRECDETEARLESSEHAPEESALTRHRIGVQSLMAWLAAPQPGNGKQVGVMVAAIAGGVAMVAAAFSQAWVAVVTAAIALTASLVSLRDNARDGRAAARRDFERQRLDGPAAWNQAAVEQTLEVLQQAFDQLRLAQQRHLTVAGERQRLQRLQQALEEKEQQKRQLAAEIGFDPGLTALGVDHFVRRVQDYQEALERRQGLERIIGRLEQAVDEGLEGIHQFLSNWHVTAAGTPVELDAALSDLAERTGRAEAQLAIMAQKNTELERLQDDVAEREARLAALYRNAGLEPGDRPTLEAAIEKLDSWKAQQQRLQGKCLEETQRHAALADDPRLISRAENGEREALEQERDQAEAEAAELNDLLNERARIEAEVRGAGASRLLEEAGARVDEATTALQDRMNEQLFAEAGHFLLDAVESEHRTEHEPEVLRDARERFQRFTHHAWDLELGDSGLRAKDLQQNRLREPGELSSGTRMQMLLALRLAWTRRLELVWQGLPLFLDEALTTADEQRFAAVAQSLETLAAEEGRQVFYLSARRQEVALWEKVTGARPHHIDLARVRRMGEAAAPADYGLAPEQPLPAPDDKTPAAYAAELAVPPVTPLRPVTELHLFHLLRDNLGLLYRLMRDWNVSTLGQLRALLASQSAANAIADTRIRARLAGRSRAVEAWAHAWQLGRGKPVDRIALEASGSVSANFIDDVCRLAQSCGGDGARIIAGLSSGEVARFRTRNIEELQRWLEDNGFISAERQLDAGDRERQTLFTAGPDVDADDIRQLVRWLEAAVQQ